MIVGVVAVVGSLGRVIGCSLVSVNVVLCGSLCAAWVGSVLVGSLNVDSWSWIDGVWIGAGMELVTACLLALLGCMLAVVTMVSGLLGCGVGVK